MQTEFSQNENLPKKIPMHYFEHSFSDFSQIPLDLTRVDEISPLFPTNFINFRGLPKEMPFLKRIDISGLFKSISGLPASLPELTSFTLLTENILDDLSGFPQKVPKLSRIDIRGDYRSFTGLPLSLPSLEEYCLDQYYGQDFTGFPQELPKLRIIDFSETLWITTHWPLESFRGLPSSLPSLERMIIIRSNLKNFHGFPKNTPRLEYLDAWENEITSLAGIPQVLPSLKQMCLSYNELTDLEGLPEMPTIQCLDFAENPLRSLYGLASEYLSLEIFSLYKCQLTSLEFFPKSLPRLRDLSLYENHLERLEGIPHELPALELITVYGNPIRTLSFLGQDIIRALIMREDNRNGIQISSAGAQAVATGDPEVVYRFYQRTPAELAVSLAEGKTLSKQEEDRLVYEANYADLGILRRNLDDSHPVVKAICARIGDFPADIVRKLDNGESILPNELEHPALPQYAAFLIDYCLKLNSENAKTVVDLIKRQGFNVYTSNNGRFSLPNLLL